MFWDAQGLVSYTYSSVMDEIDVNIFFSAKELNICMFFYSEMHTLSFFPIHKNDVCLKKR